MRIRPFLSALPVTALAAALLVAVGGEPTRAAAAAPAGRFSVDWTTCPQAPDTQCGTLHVPVDWSEPDGPRIALNVARRPADDPGRRVGTLFFNAGGPGDGAAQYVTGAAQVFSATLRARFDIVGLDPRATGGSANVRCPVPPLTPTTTLFPRSEAQFQELRRHNRAVGLSCLRETGALMRHTDTVSVARDHEALRIALGVGQVNWLGLSYGTQVAANYAQLFPRRTRAMALDAALEHSQPEVLQVADEMVAAETAFNRFVAWCATAPTCALRGQDVGGVYDRLVADADRQPIPVAGSMRGVTGEDIRMGTIRLLVLKEPSIFGPEVSWAGLSRALARTIAGDAANFALPPLGAPQDGLSSVLAIACMEYVPQIHTYAQMRQRIELGRRLAPHLQGASETWRVSHCMNWPVPVANPPRLLDVRGVPTLIAHAVYDPSVPYKWAHSLAAQIRGSEVLTRTGDGHTSYHTSPCARAALDGYLVLPRPPADLVCDE